MYKADRLREETFLPIHYNYVIPICRHPGMSQEQLARHVYLDKCNVTRHLSKLEENGYVERRSSDSDKRVTLVYPTGKLEALFPKIRQANQEWDSYILDGLSEDEIRHFEETLFKIVTRAKEYVNSKDEIGG